MSSHMFEEVEKTCDRIGIIRQGHMAAIEDTATLQKIRQRPIFSPLQIHPRQSAF